MGAPIVVLKAGHRGLYLRTGQEERLRNIGRIKLNSAATWAGRENWVPGFKVKVVGTTGAGDASIAGFLMGLLREMPPERVLEAACAAGACAVEASDSISGMKSWPEITARLKSGWPRLPLDLQAEGWQLDRKTDMWFGRQDRSRSLSSSINTF
jgi:sugar/nucleoside kinase (ribokinase family)